MDNDTFDAEVTERVTRSIKEDFGSVNAAAKASAIPYASLDRKLRNPSLFTVAELRRLAQASGRQIRNYLPETTALAAEALSR